MHKKLYTRAMSFFLAVLMSFTLLMPETFATGSNSDYDDSGEESVVTVDGTDEDVDASANEENYGIEAVADTVDGTEPTEEAPDEMSDSPQYLADGKTSFAIFDETDNSLNFYYDDDSNVPSKGSSYKGKYVTNIYKNLESTDFTSSSNVTWIDQKYNTRTINVDSSFKDVQLTSMAYWFCDFQNLNTINGIENFNTSKVTSFNYTFSDVRVLQTLDLSSWDTSSATDMSYMFDYMSCLTTINLSGFDTSNVTTMEYMFHDCYRLRILDLSSFNTKKVVNMKNMFYACYALSSIYVQSDDAFSVDNVTSSNGMFTSTNSLVGQYEWASEGADYHDKTYARIDTSDHTYSSGRGFFSQSKTTNNVVLNLGAGNGINNNNFYSGNDNAGTDLRYTVSLTSNTGMATIHLPSDNDLGKTFTIMSGKTVSLESERAYDYKLVGWINIATSEYYDVSNGSCDATISLSADNVFYPDWIAADYDNGSSTDDNLRDDIVDTSDFVTIHVFDYNELVNMYSASLTQDGSTSEKWDDSTYLQKIPVFKRQGYSLSSNINEITSSFIFNVGAGNDGIARIYSQSWNEGSGPNRYSEGGPFVQDAKTTWEIEKPGDTVLGLLFNTSETNVIYNSSIKDTAKQKDFGVHYVGDASSLFWKNKDGYYEYNQAESAAVYNQSEQRFYVYNDPQDIGRTYKAFLPFNSYSSNSSEYNDSNGTINYWFGLETEFYFYLENGTSDETNGNTKNGKDMTFNFAGDDDLLVFVDDQLVLDLSGMHNIAYGQINFNTGYVTRGMGIDSDGNIYSVSGLNDDYSKTKFEVEPGGHTMTIYYLERGGYDSNLDITFNLEPAAYVTKTADADTYTVGDTVTYTITASASNESTWPLENCYVEDTLPSELQIVSATATQGGTKLGITVDTNSNYFKTDTTTLVKNGDSIEITVTATAKKAGESVENTVELKNDNGFIAKATEEIIINEGGNLSFNKIAADTNNKLSGAKFVMQTEDDTYLMFDSSGNYIGISAELTEACYMTSNSNGTVSVDHLPEGEYTLIEVSAPEGYKNNSATYNVSVIKNYEYDSSSTKVTWLVTSNIPSAGIPNEQDQIQPALDITKTVNKTTAKIGDEVTYTVTVNETVEGAKDTNVVVSDTIDSNMTITNVTTSVGTVTSQNNNDFTVTISDLEYGTTVTITVKAKVDSGTFGNTVTNTAKVMGDLSPEKSDTATFTIEASDAVIECSKSVSPADNSEGTHGTFYVGDTVTYTINVTQTEQNADTAWIMVTDTLPAGLTYVNATTNTGNFSTNVGHSGQVITCNISDLAYGETVSITITATVGSELAGKTNIENYAKVENVTTGTSQNTNSVYIDVLAPALDINKTVDKSIANVGDTLTYTITVTQTVAGAVDKDIVVTDTLADGLTIVGAPTVIGVGGSTVSVIGQTVTVTIPELRDTASIVIQATVGQSLVGTTVKNVAIVGDPYTPDTPTPETETEVPSPALSIVKKADKDVYNVGEQITYTLTVTETVPDVTDYNVVVTDELDSRFANVTIDGLRGVKGSLAIINGVVTAYIPELNYGDTAIIVITAIVTAEMAGDTNVANTAVAKDPYNPDKTTTTEVEVLKPDVSITKVADSNTYHTGDKVTYTLTVEETVANAVDYNVIVTDTFSEYLTDIHVESISGDAHYDIDGQKVTITIPELAYGETEVIVLSAVITKDAVGQKIENIAVVTDPYGNTDTGKEEIEVGEPAISLTKEADKETYNSEETVTYTLTLAETEEGVTDYDVIVTDTLDDLFTNVQIVSVEGAKADYYVSGQTAYITVPELAYGDVVTIKISATLTKDAAGQTVENMAHAVDYDGKTAEDSETIKVLSPSVNIEKVADAETYTAGERVFYTLTVTQPEEGMTTYDVVVTDTLDSHFSDVRVVDADGGVASVSGNTVTVVFDSLKYGETRNIVISGVLDKDSANATIQNVADVEDYYGHKDSDDTSVYVVKPNIDIQKSVSETTANVGDEITYTLTVTEVTPDATDYDVTVTDVLPDGLEHIAVVSDLGVSGSVSVSGNEVTVYIPELHYGETCTIVLTAEVGRSAVGTTLVNTGYVKDYYDNENSSTVVTDVIRPNVSVVKESDKDKYNVGEYVTYTFTITETVEDAIDYDVTVRDPIPEGLSDLSHSDIIGADGNVYIDNGTLVIYIPELSYGQTAYVTVTALVTRELVGEEFINTAYIEDYCGNTGEDDAKAEVYHPDLSIDKSVDADKHNVGDTVTYTLTVEETVEDAISYGVEVTDVFPEGLDLTNSIVSVEGVSGATYNINGQTLSVNIPVLRYGETVTIHVTAVVTRALVGAEVTNVATVTDIYEDTHTDDEKFDVYQPEYTVNKIADKDIYNVGDTITYTITVTETAENAIDYGITVTDELPEGLTDIAIINESGTYAETHIDGQTVTAYIPELDWGQPFVLTITATVGRTLHGATLDNLAIAEDIYETPEEGEETSEVLDPFVDVEKTADKNVANVGEEVTYTITVKETTEGAVDYDVILDDIIPEGLSDVTYTHISGVTGLIYMEDGEIHVYIPELWYGETATITVTGLITRSCAGTDVVNTVTAEDYAGHTDEDFDHTDVYMPDVAIAKDVDKAIANVGENAEYTLTVTQPVENAVNYGVVVTDTFADELSVENAVVTIEGTDSRYDASYAWDGQTLTVYIPVLKWTDTVTITVSDVLFTRTSAGEDIVNVANITDIYNHENENETDTEVYMPDIEISKDADGYMYNSRDTVVYTFTVNETVPNAVDYGVTVTDTFHDGLDLTNSTVEITGVEGATYSIDGQDLTVYIPVLRSTETAVITVTTYVMDDLHGEIIDNTVYVTDIYDHEDDDDTDIEVYQPTPTIDERVNKEWVNVGENVVYTITVGEGVEGAIDYDLVVTDTFDDGLYMDNAKVTVEIFSRDSVEPLSIQTFMVNPESDTPLGDREIWWTLEGQDLTVYIEYLRWDEYAVITVEDVLVSRYEEGEHVDNDSEVDDPFGNEEHADAEFDVYAPDVAVTKEASNDWYNVDDMAEFTFTVTQPVENAINYGVTVTDEFAEGFDLTNAIISVNDEEVVHPDGYTDYDGDVSVTIDGQTVTIYIPVQHWYETYVITVSDVAVTSAIMGNNVANTVVVNDIYDDEDEDTIEIEILQPELSVIKTADSEYYSLNDTVTYTITVEQTVENAIAFNTVISDTVPEELLLQSVVATDSEGNELEVVFDEENGFTVDCGDMNYNEPVVVTVEAVAIAEGENVVNTAVGSADYIEPEEGTTEVIVREPILVFTKTADCETAYPGDIVTYTMTLESIVPETNAYNVVISDTMPEGMKLIDVVVSDGVDGEITIDDNSFTVAYDVFAYGDISEITVTAEALDDPYANTTQTNVATVTSDNSGPTEDEADVDIIKPIIDIEKTSDKNTYCIDEEVVYTITVAETVEGVPAYDVVVTDELPDGMKAVDATLSGVEGTVSYPEATSNDIIHVYIPELNYGEDAVITITANATAGGNYKNTAVVEAPHLDTVEDETTVDVYEPELVINKHADKDTYNVGDTITYTITVNETVLDAWAEDVVITDVIPDGLTIIGIPALTGCEGTLAVDGQTITAEIPYLYSDEVAFIEVQTTASASVGGTSVTNIATVSSSHIDPIADDATVTINPQASANGTGTVDNGGKSGTETGNVKTGEIVGIGFTVIAGLGALAGIAGGTISRKRKENES